MNQSAQPARVAHAIFAASRLLTLTGTIRLMVLLQELSRMCYRIRGQYDNMVAVEVNSAYLKYYRFIREPEQILKKIGLLRRNVLDGSSIVDIARTQGPQRDQILGFTVRSSLRREALLRI